LAAQIQQLETRMADNDFWSNTDQANRLIAELKSLKATYTPVSDFQRGLQDALELITLTDAADTQSVQQLVVEVQQLESLLATLEIKTLLSDERDAKNAILSINAGAGGTESCDWAQMLLRMYRRWAEANGYAAECVDLLPGEEAGIKNVTLIIRGLNAYGYLKSEIGVHRLVRISPFDANKRRHTSFASVDVIPEADEAVEIEIKEGDLRIDVYRSGGKGGQSVNTTDSAVRITHLPTGLVVTCQDERSQTQNKAKAMHVLKSRLAELERRKAEAERQAGYAAKQRIEWGSQIRSYVLHPYNMVKDHRTDWETSNAQGVLDGDLLRFMEAYLRWAKAEA
jgi:peptide chain release factor 2